MKVLITGATGFLGRHLVKKARELKWDTSILSRRQKPPVNNFPTLRVYRGDLTSPCEELEMAFKDQDLVIHAALDYRSSRASLEMTKTVIRLCLAHRVPKIIFVSSQNSGFKNPQGYSLGKKEAEELIRQSSLHWGIVRPTVIYDERGGFLLESLIHRIGNLCFILIPGRGDATVQPVHAEDVAKAIERLASLSSGTSVTVAGSEIVSLRHLAHEVKKRVSRAVLLRIPTTLLKMIGLFHSGIRSKVDELGEIKTLTQDEEKFLERFLGSPRHGILQDLPRILPSFF